MSKSKYDLLVKRKEMKILQLKEVIRNQLLEKYYLYEEIQGPQSEEYPLSRWENNKVVFYKKIYENVSDEDLETLEVLYDKEKALSMKVDDASIDETRAVRFNATTVVGYTYIFLGFLVGFILLINNLLLGLSTIFLGVVVGVTFLTAAHIIRQLNIIINNLNNDE